MVDKAIVPTDKGMQLAAFLDRAFNNVINLDYTSNMEKDLDLIANGKKQKLVFLQAFYNNLEDTIKSNKEIQADPLQADGKVCPECGAPMVIRRSKFGKLFYGCSKYPKCRGIVNID